MLGGATLLAFDTSTEQMAVALAAPGGEYCANEPGGALASARLIPTVRRLMEQAGIGFAALDAVAFGRGPGAFTGVRTSAAVAQGLAFGAGKPVLPIDSLLIVAEDARLRLPPGGGDVGVTVAMDARMGEAYCGDFRFLAGRWESLDTHALVPFDGLRQRWRERPPQVLAGSAPAAMGLPPAAPASTIVIADEADRARALLRLARQQFAAGATVAAQEALPIYLRDNVALTTRERAAARAAAR
jgi:tRNA threonylcarbamoyladenosine biosynthesis protein TsaB